MLNPETPDNHKTARSKEYRDFDEIPKDPKQDGLRPGRFYAGGDSNEVIVVGGKKYRKEIACSAFLKDGSGRVILDRPYTEKEYFSHHTDDIGPGPGWDFRLAYLEDMHIADLDSDCFSDLPLYRLVPIDEQK